MVFFVLVVVFVFVGIVYVMLVMNVNIGSEVYEIVFMIINLMEEDKIFIINFIVGGVDGVDCEEGVEFFEMMILVNLICVFSGVILEVFIGFFEIIGDLELFICVMFVCECGSVFGVEVFVVNLDNVVLVLIDVYFKGICKDGQCMIGFGIVNLSKELINCCIDVEMVVGGVFINMCLVLIFVLLMFYIFDFLVWINNQSGVDVNVIVCCFGESFFFVQVLNCQMGVVVVIDLVLLFDLCLILLGVQLFCLVGVVCFECQGIFYELMGV